MTAHIDADDGVSTHAERHLVAVERTRLVNERVRIVIGCWCER
jgi:hypothetical protein